jgi:PAS domain S-box-containing protein
VSKTCIWFNSRWLDFTGRSMAQEIGYGWVAGIHPDDLGRCVEVYERAFDRREAYRTEYRRRRYDGEWRTLDASGVPRFIDGVFVGYIGSCIDVTDQQRADQALRASEEQLRLATEAAEVGLWDWDTETDTLYWPARVKAMFGLRPDAEVSMRDFYAGLHPDDREHTGAAFAAAVDPKQQALYDVEYRTVGKEDGAVRWVAAKGRALFRGDRCIRVLGTAIDISLRKHAEARLRELNDRLEQRVAEVLAERQEAEKRLRQSQKMDAIGQLTGGVAHDFNNLLMVISGGLSLLDRRLEPERRQRVIGQMRQAADRGASLSRQLLAFARRQPLHPEPIDLHRKVDAMRELLNRTLRGDVQVKTELARDLAPIKVDSAELELVILNLCANARDAMPDGGTITISAANVPGDFVAFRVSDTGTGMSAEVLAHLFEPFFTTKELGKGSGLGLPQVYGFAQQSGGSVEVDSAPGRGTCVTLLLPRSDEVPERPAGEGLDPSDPWHRGGEAGSILLVEDNDEVAALVSEMLRELGYGVTRAATAQAALGALADERVIDLVFSDILMPGSMSGVDLAREVRRRRPNLPVLLTTGFAGDPPKDVNAERIEVLAKPYDLPALQAAIREALLTPMRRATTPGGAPCA